MKNNEGPNGLLYIRLLVTGLELELLPVMETISYFWVRYDDSQKASVFPN